jgi:hypothetical protein
MLSGNLIPKISLACLALFLPYSWWAPSSETHAFAGDIFAVITLALLIAAMIVAAMRAYRAGDRIWMVVIIFSPPLGLLYALAVNRGGKSGQPRSRAVA